jgi:AraC-like DNA-binding protein
VLYREFRPDRQLAPYVRLIWSLELDDSPESAPPERVLPDGIVELVFHYRTPFEMRFDGEPFATQPRSFGVCQTHRYLEYRPRGPGGFVAVRFQPWGAYHFFRPPVSDLADRFLPTAALWQDAAEELEERLALTSGVSNRIDLVQQFLIDRLRRHRRREIVDIVRAVSARRGKVTITGLSRELGVAQHRLERTFRNALGTSPKHFARLCRFLYACRVLREGPRSTLAEAAQTCGYYDQAHFIRDFKALSGMTPGQFLPASRISFLESE